MLNLMKKKTTFSPPYGDGTVYQWTICCRQSVFAPLRGWYYHYVYLQKGNVVFAPLRGWYQKFLSEEYRGDVFAPLRGWYTKYITEDRKMEELNA